MCGFNSETAEVYSQSERLLLGSTIPDYLSAESFTEFINSLEEIFETHAAGKVPNFVKRVVVELPGMLVRIQAAANAEGSNQARFYIANASADGVAAMWKVSNLARCSIENRTLEADRNDALVAQVLDIPLPEETDLIKQLMGYRRATGRIQEVELTAPKKKSLLGGLCGNSRTTRFDWFSDPSMRADLNRIVLEINFRNLLPVRMTHFDLFMSSQSEGMQDKVAASALYESFIDALTVELGAQHDLVAEVRDFVRLQPTYRAAQRLTDLGKLEYTYFGLAYAGLRTSDEGPAYFINVDPEKAITSLDTQSLPEIYEEVAAALRIIASEIKQLV